jgi:hypothetical protein
MIKNILLPLLRCLKNENYCPFFVIFDEKLKLKLSTWGDEADGKLRGLMEAKAQGRLAGFRDRAIFSDPHLPHL